MKSKMFSALMNALLISTISVLTFISCSTKETFNSSDLLYETELKVMTFNIRYGSAEDGDNSWQYRKDLVLEVIRKNYPDIIGVQEALNFQLNEIIEELPGYYYIGVGRDDGIIKGEYSAIILSMDRFIVDTTETFWFSDTPQNPGSITWQGNLPRICTWALIYDKFSKKSLYVYNVHYDHQSQISREKSSEMLLKKIKMNLENHPLLITGDFNCGEDNPAIQSILKFGLQDSYRMKNPTKNDEGTFNSFIGKKSGDKIDYIFINDKLFSMESRIDHFNRSGKFPSDHFPVTAILKYK